MKIAVAVLLNSAVLVQRVVVGQDSERCLHLNQGGGYEVTIQAECAEGYHGSASIEDCNGHWTQTEEPWNLTGCVPDHCEFPEGEALEGYVITEHSIEIPDFNIEVRCADGFAGHAVVLPCTAHEETFSLSGCMPKVCTMPDRSQMVGFIIISNNKAVPHFDVDVSCDNDYRPAEAVNEEPYALPCTDSGKPFRVFGCVPELCRPPESTVGYDVSETSLGRPDFKVEARCSPGYFGSAVVERCHGHHQRYRLKHCHRGMCTKPNASIRQMYRIIETDLEIPFFQVNVSCKDGFHVCVSGSAPNGPVAVPCTADGSAYQLRGCCPDQCTEPAANHRLGYVYTVNSLEQANLHVQVSCADGWAGKADIDACQQAGGPIHFSGCSQEACTTPDLDGYNVTEISLERGAGFSVQVTCTENYLADDDGAVATECAGHGEPYNLMGCNPEVCSQPPQTDAANYKGIVEHSRNIAGFNVTVSDCAQFYTGNPKAAVCDNHDSPYTLTGCEPTYYLSPTGCPEGEDITQPQECYAASRFMGIDEEMSTVGLADTNLFYAGCFKTDGKHAVGFNMRKDAISKGTNLTAGKMVCSRSPCAQALHYVLQSDHMSKDGGGVGYCKNNKEAEDCCQVWERIYDYSECELAGRSLSFNVSNMVGEECIENLPPGCFYSPTPGMDISAVRFNLPTTPERSCGNYVVSAWTVRHICQKIIANEKPGITLEDAGTISAGDPDA